MVPKGPSADPPTAKDPNKSALFAAALPKAGRQRWHWETWPAVAGEAARPVRWSQDWKQGNLGFLALTLLGTKALLHKSGQSGRGRKRNFQAPGYEIPGTEVPSPWVKPWSGYDWMEEYRNVLARLNNWHFKQALKQWCQRELCFMGMNIMYGQ